MGATTRKYCEDCIINKNHEIRKISKRKLKAKRLNGLIERGLISEKQKRVFCKVCNKEFKGASHQKYCFDCKLNRVEDIYKHQKGITKNKKTKNEIEKGWRA